MGHRHRPRLGSAAGDRLIRAVSSGARVAGRPLLVGVEVAGLFGPVVHRGIERAARLFRLPRFDGIEDRAMEAHVVFQVEARLHRHPYRTEAEQGHDDAAEAVDETLVVRGLPHADVPVEIAANVFLRLAGLRRGGGERVEFLEPRDICGRGVPRRFFDGEGFERAPDGDRVLEVALAEVCHVGRRVGLLRDVSFELELDQRFANRRLTDAERVGQLALDEPLARLERAIEDRLPDAVRDEMAGGLRV